MAKLALIALLLAAAQSLAQEPLSARLRTEILNRPAGSFEPLIRRWEKTHGSQAAAPLLGIAGETKALGDPERYVALMAAAKLGGPAISPAMASFLKDRSWMIRSGALRALRALGDPRSGAAALPLLKDPAMVVRSEAVDTVAKLNPPPSLSPPAPDLPAQDSAVQSRRYL